MDSEKLQNSLEAFQISLQNFRKTLGVVGGKSPDGDVPNVRKFQKAFFDNLTAACAAHKVKLTSDSDSLELDQVLRMEHQSWIKGRTESGRMECVNVMDYDKIEMV